MISNPLEYGSASPPSRRKWIILLSLSALIVLAWIIVSNFQKTTRWEMDAITGSRRTYTVWNFGIKTIDEVQISPLELRLKKMRIQPTPIWRAITVEYQHGLRKAIGCGSSPPIGHCQPDIQACLNALTDADLLGLVAMMQTGSDKQQEDFLRALVQRFH